MEARSLILFSRTVDIGISRSDDKRYKFGMSKYICVHPHTAGCSRKSRVGCITQIALRGSLWGLAPGIEVWSAIKRGRRRVPRASGFGEATLSPCQKKRPMTYIHIPGLSLAGAPQRMFSSRFYPSTCLGWLAGLLACLVFQFHQIAPRPPSLCSPRKNSGGSEFECARRAAHAQYRDNSCCHLGVW